MNFSECIFEDGFEVGAACVSQANEDEEEVADFLIDVSVGFIFFRFFDAEFVAEGAGEFAEFFGESSELNERREVAFFELRDPLIDA